MNNQGLCRLGYTSRQCNPTTCEWEDWGECSVQPVAEVCGDGLDQDCNGADRRNLDVFEPNDSCAACALLSSSDDPNGSLDARIDSIDDTDYYCFWGDDGISILGPEKITIELNSIPDNADYDVYLYQGLGGNDAERQANAIENCNAGPSRALNARDGDGNLQEGINPGSQSERIQWSERFNATDTGFYIIHVKNFYGNSCTEEYTLEYDGLR